MIPNTTVKIAFDLAAQGQGDFFTLNDPIRGELDNATYTLAGDVFVDVTPDVRSIKIRRGRSWQLDEFQAGSADVVLSNNDRDYDPSNALAEGTRQNVVPNPSFELDLANWSTGSSYFTGGQTQRFNLMTNPSFEASLSGWGVGATDLTTSGAAVSLSSVQAYVGSNAAYVECSASSTTEGVSYLLPNLSPSTTYRISAYVYGDVGSTAVLKTRDVSASVSGSTSSSATTGAWSRLDSTITTGATTFFTLDTNELDDTDFTLAEGNESAVLIAFNGSEVGTSFFTLDDETLGELGANSLAPEPGAKFYVDAILVEETSILNPYFDGSGKDASLNDASLAWNGTTDLSASTLTWVVPVISQSSVQNLYGSASSSVELQTRFANQGIFTTVSGLTADTRYTISGWVYVQAGSSVKMGTQDTTNSVSGSLSSSTGLASWVRVSSSITTGAATADVLVGVFTTTEYLVAGAAPFSVFYLDGVLAETGSQLLPYFDGTTADGSILSPTTTWAGTANDSISNLTYRVPGTGSPYWPSIKPRKQIQVFVNNVVVFTGSVEDWDFSYSVNGDSITTLKAADGFSSLASTKIASLSVPEELSGERVERILNLAEVSWPASRRVIDAGQVTLAAQTTAVDGENTLGYLQKIEKAESGAVFVDGAGILHFGDRSSSQVFSGVTFDDVGTGVPFSFIAMDYGVESLRNRVVINRIGQTAVTVEDAVSIAEYGIIEYQIRDILLDNDVSVEALGNLIVGRYAQPSLRIDTISVEVKDLSSSQVQEVIGLELGDVVQVIFTPNRVGDAINQFLTVDAIEHSVSPSNHTMVFDLSETSLGFVLDDSSFGVLNVDRLAY